MQALTQLRSFPVRSLLLGFGFMLAVAAAGTGGYLIRALTPPAPIVTAPQQSPTINWAQERVSHAASERADLLTQPVLPEPARHAAEEREVGLSSSVAAISAQERVTHAASERGDLLARTALPERERHAAEERNSAR